MIRWCKYLLVSLFIMMLPLSSGCWNLVDVNKAAVVTGMGYDLVDDNKIKLTAQVIAPKAPSGEGGGESKKPYITFSATDVTSSKAARELSLTVPRIMLWQHASVYILGEDMARNGMHRINDFFDRNRNIRKSNLIIVARKTEAEPVMNADLPMSENPMFDLVTLLQNQDKQVGIYTPVLLAEYLNELVTPGMDPIIPAVELTEQSGKQMIKLSGMAMFKGDKLVGYLNESESRGYRWLRHHLPVKGGLITITSPLDNSPVLVDVLNYSISHKAQIHGQDITIKIKIREEGNFYEQSSTQNVLTPPLLKSIEARTATQIENEARLYLKRSQELGCDCAGFGIVVAQQYPDLWDKISGHWDEIYPQVKFEFDVGSKIRRFGLSNEIVKPRF